MVRRVVVTVPRERANEVVDRLFRTRHCHNLTVVFGESSSSVERGANDSGTPPSRSPAERSDFGVPSMPGDVSTDSAVITANCVDKKLNFIFSELETLGVSKDYGSIDLIALEATVPYLSSRKDNRGHNVSNKLQSIHDRLTLPEIAAAIDFQCHMTFDYLAMCAMASMICGVGLLDDNVVLVVASMLVSPLMGPIMAFIYGTMMRDRDMVRKGVRTELSGIAVIFLVGAVCGLIILPFMERNELGDWPSNSNQILSRGQTSGLITGLFVAIPSGIALALAITSDVVAPYVGVAIAAALLPPIVNSGLTFVLGISCRLLDGRAPLSDKLLTTSYVSFALVLINIIVIYMFGILTFLVKRVHPDNERTKKLYMRNRYNTSSFAEMDRSSLVESDFLGEADIGKIGVNGSIPLRSGSPKPDVTLAPSPLRLNDPGPNSATV